MTGATEMLPQQQETGETDQDLEQNLEILEENANDDAEAEYSPMEISPVRRLQCLILALALVVIGFDAALNEARVNRHHGANHSSLLNLPWYMRDNPNLWVCLFIKCAQLSMGIGAIFYLQHRVTKPGRIEKARFHNPSMPQRSYTLKNLHQFRELPDSLANYPTKMFISIFIIFAILGAACSLAETIGDCIDAYDPDIYEIIPYAYILRCVLLFVFIAMQTVFFVRHNRACLQWKLVNTWFAMSIVLSTNLSLWFFYVSQETYNIVNEIHTCGGNLSTGMKLRKELKSAAEITFPFLIEFFLMGAILSCSFLSNAGRLNQVLCQIQQRFNCLTTEAIRDQLLAAPDSDGRVPASGLADRFRQHSRSLLFGLALVLSALIISVPMKLLVCLEVEKEREPWHVTFTYILVLFYASGTVCCVVLLRAFRSAIKPSVEAKSRTAADRLMLWCGVVAVLVNELNRFWGAFQSGKDLQNAIGTGFVTLLNICQSVLQVYVLECILLHRLRSTDVEVGGSRQWGARLLTFLMLINALEWLISAVAFSLFFLYSSSISSTPNLALLVICAPLQVFFRFHSIGCIHEFRKHCREDGYEPLNRSPSVQLDFPTITPTNYGSIV